MSDIAIRPLVDDDAEAFKALRLQAIQDAPTAIWPTHDEESGRTLEETRNRIRTTDHQIVFGAFAGQALIGIAGLRREPLAQVAHKAVLWGVFVDPAHRRGGIAGRLLDAAIEHARAARVLQIQLCVNAENPRAQQLYRNVGFETFGVERRAMRVGDRFFDEEHMALRLDT
ncbi:GNAT family N-acetyltransferase [Ralstonia sp. ASV6]|uniref:GNAT family N-acetyltransferase n=1 Tax=Ralstonia sp. ASV6 TaxID=2795124 RepID=UPI0018EB809C|nr:GNAT family N-acetyltransferase [Ralstonia sp. ASV6]